MVDRTNVLVFIFTLNPEFRLLLLKRTEEKGGFWQPVSGGIDPEETAFQTVAREVREETGIDNFVRVIDLEHTFTYRTDKDGVMMDMRDICFAIEVEAMKEISLSEEHVEYRWCNLKEAEEFFRWELGVAGMKKLVDLI